MSKRSFIKDRGIKILENKKYIEQSVTKAITMVNCGKTWNHL